ncbi:MAG: TonB-dependent receptor [Bacteroidetes bacterium]|nr:MAG: TonB-dependent receptor [Bacteroidota bacterium]
MNRFYRLIAMPLIFIAIPVFGLSQVKLSGIVTDQSGNALSEANVLIKDTYLVTSTDLTGRFSFGGLKKGSYQLSISYIGFERSEITIDLKQDTLIEVSLIFSPVIAQEFTVIATRADEHTPIVYSTITKKEIEENNVGQDIPELLNQSPSMVSTSDAGTGIGYSYLRLRGADQTSINVTINGVPVNDAESQNVFWVDLPDIASSTQDIQIQRGVGISTNGAGAFGGAINLLTDDMNTEPYGQINLGFGSFNTLKGSVKLGTGLINEHWTVNGRLSYLKSDGYIDRSNSELFSYYVSGSYTSNKTSLKFLSFGANEITQQAWNGVPRVRLENDEQGMLDYAAASGYGPEHTENLLTSNRRYNYYTWQDEVDNYTQISNQLVLTQEINRNWFFNATLHYTRGFGYFEQYQYEENAYDDNHFSDYGLVDPIIGNDTISSSDFIRQRWLDNHFYGLVASVHYQKKKWKTWFGGAFNRYDGQHYGEVIWSTIATTYNVPHRYYDNDAIKTDGNVYWRVQYLLNEKISFYGDIQYRNIHYSFLGIDNDGNALDQEVSLGFVNPKVGLNYQLNQKNRLFISFAVGNKEPNRDDYIIAPPNDQPQSQTLYDTELGYSLNIEKLSFEAVFYNMQYSNQLIQTGELNDVGEEIRTNVKDSYRRGIELVLSWRPVRWFEWKVNTTFSQNKINNHIEYIDNWETWGKDTLEANQTDLAYSPSVIGGSQLKFRLFQLLNPNISRSQTLHLNLISKYVGKQFIDNTSDDTRSLDPYFINDIRLNYSLKNKTFKNLEVIVLVRNIFNVEYVSNGWVYKYNYEGRTSNIDGLFPQAGINFLLGVNFGF